ncbi:MAG: alpha-amylase family glycosyl hydrolase [Sphingobacteriaceae bacterium]|jgi:glycosidase
MKKTLLALFISLASIITSNATAQIVHPNWAQNAVVYEVNVRQFSESGNISGVTQQLERLKSLGVDILWLMPLHPIGVEKRKGTLGSYYSVKDYKAFNPEFGTEMDFQFFVKKAHDLGFKVIIDWVANHTAWDHEWVKKNPDWYERDAAGKIQTPYDWTDVAKLNYSSKPMRAAMTDAMKHWITKYDIDGFRCDVAFLVPVGFWNENRKALEKIKPMYMLAEMEANNDINKIPAEYYASAFNASYAWTFMGASADLVARKKSVTEFKSIMQKNYAELPSSMHKLFFLTNHDENTWNATINERYGENWKAIAALVYTLPQSLPLMYTGEEAGLARRLKFFDKDPIKVTEWSDTSRYAFYRNLIQLHHTHPALKNNQAGSKFEEFNLIDENTGLVYGYKRTLGKSEVIVFINLSEEFSHFNINGQKFDVNNYQSITSSGIEEFQFNDQIELPPFSFFILHK